MTQHHRPLEPTAIVIGGSIAGLLAAHALHRRFAEVIVLERDRLPLDASPRRGVPQGRHGHGLLTEGYRAMGELVPGLADDLVKRGAITGDLLRDVRWFYFGGYKARFESGLPAISMSRPALESVLRERAEALPNITLRTETRAAGLTVDRGVDRIRGVRLEDGSVLSADLVVDATGRGSATPRWLEAIGYEPPPLDEVAIDVGYASRTYRRSPDDLGGDRGVVLAPTPPDRRVGFMLAIEGQRWIVSIGGWLGDHAPTQTDGYLAFARSLPRPDIYEVIRRAEPLSDIVVHKLPSNLRRRYEHMKRIPRGLVVVGDALCSFNPIYAQGMTVAALEALALRACAESPSELAGLSTDFFARASKLLDNPWMLAVSHDFRYQGVKGRRPFGTGALHHYVVRLHDAANDDPTVCLALFRVANMISPPSSLFRPSLVARVIGARLSLRSRQNLPKK
jgi:2-polyprenyl-6-methoxyphenol hydroxylase-like FAD-dependent oxidoreductase